MNKLRGTLIYLFVAFVCLASGVQAQSTSGSGTESWGGYNWQVDQAPVTTTLNSTFSFNTTAPGLVQITVPISRAMTIHEVHGNITLATWGSGNNGSIIAEFRDIHTLNVIAAVKLQQFGQGSINLPISGTFPTPFTTTTTMQLQFDVDIPVPQTVTFGLVIN
jgi:hypothetical protein